MRFCASVVEEHGGVTLGAWDGARVVGVAVVAPSWKQIIATIEHDLGRAFTVESHRFVGDGEYVAHHMTLHGRHEASTMPLLDGVEPTGNDVSWTYMHLWRVVDGQVVEHWACRDDVGLLRQVGAWPPASRS